MLCSKAASSESLMATAVDERMLPRAGTDDPIGRIFMRPVELGKEKELWANLGTAYDSRQVRPPYVAAMSSGISDSSYKDLAGKLWTYFNENPLHQPPGDLWRFSLCVFTCGIIFCPLLQYRIQYRMKEDATLKKFFDGAAAIVESIDNGNVRLERAGNRTHELKWKSFPIDQNGLPLNEYEKVGEDSMNQPRIFTHWPPLGMNLVIQVSDDVSWPPGEAPQQQSM
jgi:hypothetical protein